MAAWELRVDPCRILYAVEAQTVTVLRGILKRGTTRESV